MINRAVIIVLDSFGVGETPDANDYGDVGSNTLLGIYKNTSLKLPNMKKLGLYNIKDIGMENEKEESPIGIYGKAAEQAKGKNSPVGHWEIAGYITEEAFKTYYEGFPKELLDEVCKRTGLPGFICNEKGSGTDFLRKYGEESIRTGKPIVYTSADSVFQIAAHEDMIPYEKLHEICKIARETIDELGYGIGTVIARPFVGNSADTFARTYNRKDFNAENFGKTMIDVFKENGKKILAIGKIEDLFAGRSITRAIHTSGNTDGIERTIEAMKTAEEDLIFTNLVDFDMLYGHRNNIEGYAKALEEFDNKLPEIMENLRDDDILILTADHGNDPSTPSTDHSREYIPILVYGKNLKNNVDLGVRDTYADISATVLDIMNLPEKLAGKSFKEEIIKN